MKTCIGLDFLQKSISVLEICVLNVTVLPEKKEVLLQLVLYSVFCLCMRAALLMGGTQEISLTWCVHQAIILNCLGPLYPPTDG